MKQGDIIWVDFDPTKGREQAGHRPALVVSQTKFNEVRNLIIICPITSNMKPFRLHVLLDERTQTQGNVICEQVRTIDLLARKCKIIEQIPKDKLEDVLEAVSTIIALED
ncbi:MAG: type II toxin-antitoxin system PemK/MazF family toxin [Oscillospiraceae bacterium]|jgi:mRNA interferase MazF|nr:type II toxin-antitoxin system PemK/MazF family toxin [Oscillospiraceae bacterium]